jgi:hypothetical protein
MRPRTGLGVFSRHIQSAMRASGWPWALQRAYPGAVSAISRISYVTCGLGPGLGASAGISRVPWRRNDAYLT